MPSVELTDVVALAAIAAYIAEVVDVAALKMRC